MRRKFVCFVFFAVFLCNAFSLEVPPLSGAINDLASFLKEEERAELEAHLRELDESTKIQIALLTIPSLEGEDLEDYSLRVVEEWKLGERDANSGALLLIAKNEKKIRIEVGYGLEKDLTDAASSQIIRKIIQPFFKKGDYYEGIKEGLFAMEAYARKDELLIKEVKAKTKKEKKERNWFRISDLIIFLIIYIFVTGRFGGNIFWPLFFFSQFFGYGGRYGKRKKKGGSFGSFSLFDDDSSGNSFSGKGGSFGGGGASGGW